MTKFIRFARLVRPAMLWAVCGFLGLASSAQAVYVELGDNGAHPAISVQTETHMEQISISIFGGGTTTFEVTRRVFEFTDGPIMLRSVTIQGASAPTLLQGPDGTTLLTKKDAEWVPRLITAIETKTFGINGVRAKIGVDIAPPSSPIPEPGAALLFAAGLGAVAARTRRSA